MVRYLVTIYFNWYSKDIWEELETGKDLDDIDIKLTLTVLKPLHTSWLVDLYDYLTSQGAEIVSNGWRASGVTEAIVKGTNELESLDPFASLDPLDGVSDCLQDEGTVQATEERIGNFIT